MNTFLSRTMILGLCLVAVSGCAHRQPRAVDGYYLAPYIAIPSQPNADPNNEIIIERTWPSLAAQRALEIAESVTPTGPNPHPVSLTSVTVNYYYRVIMDARRTNDSSSPMRLRYTASVTIASDYENNRNLYVCKMSLNFSQGSGWSYVGTERERTVILDENYHVIRVEGDGPARRVVT